MIEINYFYSPFSWFNKYSVLFKSIYNWNIFVAKMFRLKLHFLKLSSNIKNVLFYDGPDFNSKQQNMTNDKMIVFTSFQCSVIFQVFLSDNDTAFQMTTLKKYKIPNYKSILVTKHLKLQKLIRKPIEGIPFYGAYKFYVSMGYHVNITISSFNFSGSNIGYCKYGGLSIYDGSNFQEVLLLCNTTISLNALQSIVSFGSSLYLVIYSYSTHDDIHFNVIINPTGCQGVHVKRLVLLFISLIWENVLFIIVYI